MLLLRLFVDKTGPDAGIDAAVAAIVAAESRDAFTREVLVEPLVSG